MMKKNLLMIALLAVSFLFVQAYPDTIFSADSAAASGAKKDASPKKGIFSFLENFSPKNIIPARATKIENLDSVVDYMKSRGIKGKPAPNMGLVGAIVMEFSNALSGQKIQNHIFMVDGETLLYGVFEYNTKIQAEASVENIKIVYSSYFEGVEEKDVYAINKDRFVIATLAKNAKIVNVIRNY